MKRTKLSMNSHTIKKSKLQKKLSNLAKMSTIEILKTKQNNKNTLMLKMVEDLRYKLVSKWQELVNATNM